MDGRTVIVGCGYVGAALAESLRRDLTDGRASLCVTTRSAASRDRLRERGFDARAVDILDTPALAGVLAGADRVIVTVAAGRGSDYHDVYTRGMSSILDALAIDPVPSLVYTSSSGVYAEDAGGWVDEESPVSRSTERSRALVEAESLLLQAGREGRCRAAVLRLSGIVGPGRGPQRRLDALAGAERADGDAWLNLVWLDDIVAALRAVLQQSFSGIVNVSGSRPLRKREFYDVLLARAGLDPIVWEAASAPGGKRVRTDRLRSALGVEPLAVDPNQLPLS